MDSIACVDKGVQAVNREVASLREWNARLEEELDYQRRLNGVSTKYLTPTDKIVMWAVKRYILVLWHIDNAIGEHVQIYMPEIAVITGLTPKAVGRSIQALHSVGMLDRLADPPTRQDNGRMITRVYVALTYLSLHPEELYVSDEKKERNWGGERQYCRFCGSDKLVKRKVVTCKCCGNDQDEPEETPINPPLDDDPVDLADDPDDQADNISEIALPDTSPLPVVVVADPVDQGDEDTEKRPVVRPILLDDVPTMPPDVPCKFGCGYKWIWFPGDEKEPAGYVCGECYSCPPDPGAASVELRSTWKRH